MLIAQAGVCLSNPPASERRGAVVSATAAGCAEAGADGAGAAGLGITGPAFAPVAVAGLADAAGTRPPWAGVPWAGVPESGGGGLAMAVIHYRSLSIGRCLGQSKPASKVIVSCRPMGPQTQAGIPRFPRCSHGASPGGKCPVPPCSPPLAGGAAGRRVRSAVPRPRNFGRIRSWPRAKRDSK